jgi:hypothetical protein
LKFQRIFPFNSVTARLVFIPSIVLTEFSHYATHSSQRAAALTAWTHSLGQRAFREAQRKARFFQTRHFHSPFYHRKRIRNDDALKGTLPAAQECDEMQEAIEDIKKATRKSNEETKARDFPVVPQTLFS